MNSSLKTLNSMPLPSRRAPFPIAGGYGCCRCRQETPHENAALDICPPTPLQKIELFASRVCAIVRRETLWMRRVTKQSLSDSSHKSSRKRHAAQIQISFGSVCVPSPHKERLRAQRLDRELMPLEAVRCSQRHWLQLEGRATAPFYTQRSTKKLFSNT